MSDGDGDEVAPGSTSSPGSSGPECLPGKGRPAWAARQTTLPDGPQRLLLILTDGY